jgi:hypothetical protein
VSDTRVEGHNERPSTFSFLEHTTGSARAYL